MFTACEVLQQGGLLARQIDYFSPRESQQIMATAVEQALQRQQVLICEAGTGTGKTYAYLVPALLSGKKIIISTGTRNLQDQLYHRDLPMVKDALGVPVTTALLKGRANYLCLHRTDNYRLQGRLKERRHVDQLAMVRDWSGRTVSGDIAELTGIPEDASIWPQLTSTVENCLGQECPEYSECFVMKARRKAQEADLVVVNHHLFFADMALREEGFGEVLPGANAFIMDEAHQLPEVASRFFGTSISSRQLQELVNDSITAQIKEAREEESIRKRAENLRKDVMDLQVLFRGKESKGSWPELNRINGVKQALQDVEDSLELLSEVLQVNAERGKDLEGCSRRSVDILNTLRSIIDSPPEQHIQWYELRRKSFSFYLTPLNIAEPFSRYMESTNCSWIFTSATLAVGESFQFFKDRLGLEEVVEQRLDSPFDFEKQSLLYHPKDLPEPNTTGYTQAVVAAAIPVIGASGGRCFFLFTSYRALNQARDILEEEIDYPLLVQGTAPRDELLEQFRSAGDAVLLGTSSFWEGVDVRGEALSCVIIDKLPFAPPDDPVLQARLDAMKRNGANPFMDYQLPQAVILLKQGVGRLIRDVQDRGVMVLCDPRLTGKPYGKIFLRSLPMMRRSRDLQEVNAFFSSADSELNEAYDEAAES
ncbi:MAG: ATP-dependent DNA helicase [Gammaproteobacteria bacterium]|nr:MAG: ATP-dependent DNA helicase [Gammaproteobacteria bacterium]